MTLKQSTDIESSKIALEIAKNVFSSESERKKDIETRAGVLLGFNGLILVTLLSSQTKIYEKGLFVAARIQFDVLINTPIIQLPIFSDYAPIGSMLLFFLASCLLLWSFCKFVNVLAKLRQYKGIDMATILRYCIDDSRERFCMKSAAVYSNAIEFNRKLNSDKIEEYAVASRVLLLGVIVLVIWHIFHNGFAE